MDSRLHQSDARDDRSSTAREGRGPREPLGILFLCHRLPYPPDKGDKIRSWHVLSHLAAQHRVHLGCFFDDPEDAAHVPRLESICNSVRAFPIGPIGAGLRAARSLATGDPISFGKFRDPRLDAWAREICARSRIDVQVILSAAMARCADAAGFAGPRVMDFVDVESEKWSQYAGTRPPPLSWVLRREAWLVGAAERRIAIRAGACLFVSEAEAALFRRRMAREIPRGVVRAMPNGVDLERFDPAIRHPNPFDPREPAPVVFIGRMDYWANADAAVWFVREVLPRLHRRVGPIRFHVIGAAPTRAVRALSDGRSVVVTGRVPDVRPYLAHAALAVAPLRVARGIQNKILEAMAAGKAVVASSEAFEGVDAVPGRDLVVADGADRFAEAAARLLLDEAERDRLGRAARARMAARYPWPAQLAILDELIEALRSGRPADTRGHGRREDQSCAGSAASST
jgi:sugar transferase (PEP-CTERM/EpsH1 system associated)